VAKTRGKKDTTHRRVMKGITKSAIWIEEPVREIEESEGERGKCRREEGEQGKEVEREGQLRKHKERGAQRTDSDSDGEVDLVVASHGDSLFERRRVSIESWRKGEGKERSNFDEP
jgi:hypothetical protein